MKVENKLHPNEAQRQGFQEGDTETPIYMLNLLKFKATAEYEDGRATNASGAEAYGIYASEVVAHLAKVGGNVVFGGKISRLMLGEVEDLWDSAALVMYPSRTAMLTMIQDSDYLASAEHRAAGLEGQLNIEIKGGRGVDQL